MSPVCQSGPGSVEAPGFASLGPAQQMPRGLAAEPLGAWHVLACRAGTRTTGGRRGWASTTPDHEDQPDDPGGCANFKAGGIS